MTEQYFIPIFIVDAAGSLRCKRPGGVTVSRRIGHSNPTVTLGVYAHLFGNTDDRASAAVETALAGDLGG